MNGFVGVPWFVSGFFPSGNRVTDDPCGFGWSSVIGLFAGFLPFTFLATTASPGSSTALVSGLRLDCAPFEWDGYEWAAVVLLAGTIWQVKAKVRRAKTSAHGGEVATQIGAIRAAPDWHTGVDPHGWRADAQKSCKKGMVAVRLEEWRKKESERNCKEEEGESRCVNFPSHCKITSKDCGWKWP